MELGRGAYEEHKLTKVYEMTKETMKKDELLLKLILPKLLLLQADEGGDGWS